MKYLLSTGEVTSRLETYIIDIFRLWMKIYPGDIPGNSMIGFNFILTDVKKSELAETVRSRVTDLVNRLSTRFSGVTITLESVELLSSELARVTIKINQETEQIEINI